MKVTARCEREAGWWTVTVPEHRGLFTQARRLDQVCDLVCDAVGLWLEVDPATIEVQLDVKSFADDRRRWQVALDARSDALDRAEAATAESAEAVRALIGQGLTTRDVGMMLGISHQRVAQLNAADPPSAANRRAKTAAATKSAAKRVSKGRAVRSR